MSGWWVGLACRWCDRPVKVTPADATFHFGLREGGPWAEHHACKEGCQLVGGGRLQTTEGGSMTYDEAIFEEFGVKDIVEAAARRGSDLFELGFQQDEYGQFAASNCRVTFYQVGGEYEVDVVLPGGAAVGFDVPLKAVHSKRGSDVRGG